MLNRKKTVPQPSDYAEVMNQVQVTLLLGLFRSSVPEYTRRGTIPHLKTGPPVPLFQAKVLQWVEGAGIPVYVSCKVMVRIFTQTDTRANLLFIFVN